MGPKHASREKILSMVIFLIFVQKNVYRNRFQEAKMPLNLTSEGQKYPPEVRVQHETCSVEPKFRIRPSIYCTVLLCTVQYCTVHRYLFSQRFYEPQRPYTAQKN